MAKRGRVELKLIEDKTARQVRFSKRRSGLFKKAFELAVMCNAEVALLVFSESGKLYEYSSLSSIEETYSRYKQFTSVGKDSNNGNAKEDADDGIQKKCEESSNSNIQRDFTHWCTGLNVDQIDASELGKLEDILMEALRQTQYRKVSLTERTLDLNGEPAATYP